MARPAISTVAEVRSAVQALLSEAGIGASPSRQSFRRAVSVRKVRERLGGGNPATLGREINQIEAELAHGVDAIPIPDLPADIAALMTQLWQAAVGTQLDELQQLRIQAQAVATAAQDELQESRLRSQVLQEELAQMRTAIADRDMRLAQTQAINASLEEQIQALRGELSAAHQEGMALKSQLEGLTQTQAQAVATARDRYDGLSKQLLQETALQRQAVQQEVSRLGNQLKFAEKRDAAQLLRLNQLEVELQELRGERDKANGEAAALRYVNSTLRAQVDDIVQTMSLPARRVGSQAPKAATKSPKGLGQIRLTSASKTQRPPE